MPHGLVLGVQSKVALGLATGRGQAAAPAPAALLRRIAALERHAGLVPGLAPLPGDRPATPAPPAPPAARPGWAAVVQSLVAAALLVALVAWLVRPWPGPARLSTAAPPAPVAATAVPAPVPADGGTVSSGARPPLPAPDCPLDTAGPCLGQWSSPLAAP